MKKVRALLTGIVSLLLVITIFGCSADTNTPNRQVEEKRKLEIEIPDGNSDTMTISVPTGVNEVKYIIVGKGEEAPTPEEIMKNGSAYVSGVEIKRPEVEEGVTDDDEYVVYVVATNKDDQIIGSTSSPWKAPVKPEVAEITFGENDKAIITESNTEGAKIRYYLVEYTGQAEETLPPEYVWERGKEYKGESIDLDGSYYVYTVAKLGSVYSDVTCQKHIKFEVKIPDGNSDTMVINVPEPNENETIEVKYIIKKKGEEAPTAEEIANGGDKYVSDKGISRPVNEDGSPSDEEYVVYVVTTTTISGGQPAISGVVVSAPWKAPESPSEPEVNISGNKVVITESTENEKVRYYLVEYAAGPQDLDAEYVWINGKDYYKELELHDSYYIYFVGKLGDKYSDVRVEVFKWIEVVIPDGNSKTATIDIPVDSETQVKYVLVEKGKPIPSISELWNEGKPYEPNQEIKREEGDTKEYEIIVVTKDGNDKPPVVVQNIPWKAPVKPEAPRITIGSGTYYIGLYSLNGRSDGAKTKIYRADYSRSNPNPDHKIDAETIWEKGFSVNDTINRSVFNSCYVYAVAKLGSEYSEVSSAFIPMKLKVDYHVNNRKVVLGIGDYPYYTGTPKIEFTVSNTKNGEYTPATELNMSVTSGAKIVYVKATSERFQDSDIFEVDLGLYVGRRFKYYNKPNEKTYNLIVFSAPSSGNILAIDEAPLKVGGVTWGGGNVEFKELKDKVGRSGLTISQFVMEYKDTTLAYNYPQNCNTSTPGATGGSMWSLIAERAGYTFGTSTLYTSGWFIPSSAELETVNNLIQNGPDSFDTLRKSINKYQSNGKYICWTCELDLETLASRNSTYGYYKSVGLQSVTVPATRAMILAGNFANNTYGAYACFAF